MDGNGGVMVGATDLENTAIEIVPAIAVCGEVERSA